MILYQDSRPHQYLLKDIFDKDQTNVFLSPQIGITIHSKTLLTTVECNNNEVISIKQ